MATVQTVGGAIDAEELGLTLIHEHFFSGDEAVTAQWPHVRDHEREYSLALESAEAVKGHGVKTVVEPTAMLLGRDINPLRRLASDTGLQIVPCTGIYTYDHLPQFLLNRSEDFTAELLERGYAERMFLSQDFDVPIRHGLDWFPPETIDQMQAAGIGTDWSMTFLFEQVIPTLKEGGMTDDQLETMLVENPRRWLGM